MKTALETLDNGLSALFMQRPHWQTSSVQLRVNSGALHEDMSGPQGVAHYFEHVTFQGTRDFNDYDALNTYCDHNFIDYSTGQRNAFTGLLDTTYVVNTYNLEPALKVVANLALGPTLTQSAIEKDRGGILSESRGVLAQKGRELQRRKMAIAFGDALNRLIVGTPDDVQSIDANTLRSFHSKHYRIGNMILVVCSGEDIGTQRQIASDIACSFDLENEGDSTEIDLSWLEPENDGVYAFHDETSEPNSETELALLYAIEPPENLRSLYISNIARIALSSASLDVIRHDLGISYSASCAPMSIKNRNFGANQQFSSIINITKVMGLDNLRLATDLLRGEVVERATSEKTLSRILGYSGLQAREEEQSIPSATASNILSSPSVEDEGFYDTQRAYEIVVSITQQEVAEKIRETTANLSQIHVTGPDSQILEEYLEWANGEDLIISG